MIPLLADLDREWRGGQNQFLLLLKGLYQRGHKAELLTVRWSSLGDRASKAGICVHYTSRDALRLPAAATMRKRMDDKRFDVGHVNESIALTWRWLCRRQRRAPVLYSSRV